jgi:hypothetical protein
MCCRSLRGLTKTFDFLAFVNGVAPLARSLLKDDATFSGILLFSALRAVAVLY